MRGAVETALVMIGSLLCVVGGVILLALLIVVTNPFAWLVIAATYVLIKIFA